MVVTYTRQEAISVTGVSSNILSYYERGFNITPQRMASGRKNYCFYTHEQVVLINAISLLKTYKPKTALMVAAIDRLFSRTGVLDLPLYYAVEQADWDIVTLIYNLKMPDCAWQTDLCYVPASAWKLKGDRKC